MYKICIISSKMSNEKQTKQKNFTITKKIAKHGSQAIVVIPRILESQLSPGKIVELNIKILEEQNDN